MCAGVQNVSLPMDMCQEMSHGPPIIPLTIPSTMHQIGHGTDATCTPAPTRAEIGGLAICCPKGIDCPIASRSSAVPTARHFYGLSGSLHRTARSANHLPCFSVGTCFQFARSLAFCGSLQN